MAYWLVPQVLNGKRGIMAVFVCFFIVFFFCLFVFLVLYPQLIVYAPLIENKAERKLLVDRQWFKMSMGDPTLTYEC